jgi:lipid II:glycine glycyltransferase (peptidoglycan interpeptide bridge formation enzyme)
MVGVRQVGVEELSDYGSLLQTPFWARLKTASGWKSRAVEVDNLRLLVLQRTIAPGFEISYVPMAPEDTSHLPSIAQALSETVCRTSFLIRFDLPWGSGEPPQHKRLVRLGYTIQPEATVQVDLGLSPEMLLSGFSKRVRRHIRKGEEFLTLTRWDGSEQELELWYSLYIKTGKREGFLTRPRSYFQQMLSSTQNDRVFSRLYLSYQQTQLNAGIIVLFGPSQGIYLYGASERGEQIMSGSYLLQWQAILDAQERGCGIYDLNGVAPQYSEIFHHLGGLNLFKTGFSDKIITRPGCYDYLVKPVQYTLYSTAERLRIRQSRKRR